MWSSIWVFLKNLPQIYVLLKEIVAFLSTILDAYEREQKLKEMQEAIKKAKEEKNTADLEKLFAKRESSNGGKK